jgi:hypothetical protein
MGNGLFWISEKDDIFSCRVGFSRSFFIGQKSESDSPSDEGADVAESHFECSLCRFGFDEFQDVERSFGFDQGRHSGRIKF